ncbi:hypothetical protein HanHA300_Chr04g0148651 [Helianthus annuus]|nr:hypothetical protein HanHA300_Chr04g0148651 [Helianthus annuus]KAJ0762389.1 hypothetical protein HanOQP8_Chr04g0160811 [Helianthus annuus]
MNFIISISPIILGSKSRVCIPSLTRFDLEAYFDPLRVFKHFYRIIHTHSLLALYFHIIYQFIFHHNYMCGGFNVEIYLFRVLPLGLSFYGKDSYRVI